MEKFKELEEDNEAKSKEIFELKHEMVTTQTKLNSSLQEIEDLKQELNEPQKKIVRLETALGEAKNNRK
jgi:cell division protein ZapA